MLFQSEHMDCFPPGLGVIPKSFGFQCMVVFGHDVFFLRGLSKESAVRLGTNESASWAHDASPPAI
jgi:hypothetical protein